MKKKSIIISLLLLGLLLPSFSSFTVKAINGWGAPEQLTSNTADDLEPSICGDGSKIAFTSSGFIWMINIDGTGLTQLTSGSNPSINADGTKIAFELAGSYMVWVINSDGTGLTMLPTESFEDVDPSISGDGTKIAFVSLWLEPIICVINSDNTGLTQLGLFGHLPSIDYSGSRIAYEQIYNDHDGHIWGDIILYDSDSSDYIQLTDTAYGVRETNPSISDDGSKIAFQSDIDGDYEIFVINSDGSGLIQLTNNDSTDSYPYISGDGSKIAFQSDVDGDWEIFVVNSDGSGLTQLTSNTANDEYPSICGDGSKIAFQSEVDGDPEVFVVSCGWDVTLISTLQTFNDVSEFGVRSDATDVFDIACDKIDPVDPPIGIVSYFYYPDNPSSPINFQKLSTSKIAPAPMMTWTYKVKPISVEGTANIEWNPAQIANIPLDQGVYLICPDDSLLDMRSVTSYTFSAESDTTYTFQIVVGGINWNLDLDPGWNMVSFPALPDDASFLSIFAGVPFYQVITWDGSGYVTPPSADTGVGYWVLVLEETTVTVESAIPVTSYGALLSPGWSMIGSIYGETVNADDVFPSFYQLLTWDGSSYVSSTTIEPGKGYWALVLEPTTITVG